MKPGAPKLVNFKTLRNTLAATAILAVSSAQFATADEQIHIIGWLEHARVAPVNIKMDAKLDTGAKTSAIHAEILSRDSLNEEELAEIAAMDKEDEEEIVSEESIELSSDEGRDRPHRVVFRISNEDGQERILEREIVRYVSIKKRGGGVEERPVVNLELCIAGIPVEGDVSLANRAQFNYPLLVGRDMLDEADIAVNPSAIYTASARC